MKSLARCNFFVAKCLVVLCLADVGHVAYCAADLQMAELAVRRGDFVKGYELYHAAAIAGDAEAQYQLGNLYSLGKGVEVDEGTAKMWWEKAAASGHAASQYSLALLLMSTSPDEAQALMEAADEAGYRPAKLYLSRAPVNTRTKELSINEQWFSAAAKNRVAELKTVFPEIDGVNVRDPQGRTAIYLAVQHNSIESIKWLLGQGANVNQADKYGNHIGFLLIDNNADSLYSLLLQHGLQTDILRPNGDTLLHYALRRERTAWVARLISSGVPVNHKNEDGWTPLDLAEFMGNNDAVKKLQQHSARQGDGWQQRESQQAEVNALLVGNGNNNNAELLREIINNKNVALLNAFLRQHPKRLHEPLADGSSPLGLAVSLGDERMVKALLEAGANPLQWVDGQRSLMEVAAQLGFAEVVLQLHKAGMSITAPNADGDDPIAIALGSGQLATAHKMLLLAIEDESPDLPFDDYVYLVAKADAEGGLALFKLLSSHLQRYYLDADGRSALWYAARRGDVKKIRSLLALYPQQWPEDRSGTTPLMIAAEAGCMQCLSLLSDGYSVNQQSKAGNTALVLASAAGQVECVHWLLTNGAEVDIRNRLGDTALMAAVRARSQEVVNLLLAAGASASRKNNAGLSAQEIVEGQRGQASIELTL